MTAKYTARAEQFILDSTRESHDGDVDDDAAAQWVLFMSYNHVHSLQFYSKPWCLVQHVHSAWDRRCCKKWARGDWQGSTGFIDWSISRITAALKQAGCNDNTLTFFTSANGGPTNHISSQDADGSTRRSPASKARSCRAMVQWPARSDQGLHR